MAQGLTTAPAVSAVPALTAAAALTVAPVLTKRRRSCTVAPANNAAPPFITVPGLTELQPHIYAPVPRSARKKNQGFLTPDLSGVTAPLRAQKDKKHWRLLRLRY